MNLQETKKLAVLKFKGNVNKANCWWNTRNPNLGNLSPIFVFKRSPEKVRRELMLGAKVSTQD